MSYAQKKNNQNSITPSLYGFTALSSYGYMNSRRHELRLRASFCSIKKITQTAVINSGVSFLIKLRWPKNKLLLAFVQSKSTSPIARAHDEIRLLRVLVSYLRAATITRKNFDSLRLQYTFRGISRKRDEARPV